MITLEKILGALTGKENLYRCGRNFTAIEEALNNVGGTAADTSYDNTVSGMTATDVQAAVDELRAQNNNLVADKIKFAIYKTVANQSIPNNTDTTVVLSVKDTFNNENFTALNGNNIKILVGGIYDITVTCMWLQSDVGIRDITLKLSNGTLLASDIRPATTARGTIQSLNRKILLNTDDEIYVTAYQNSGNALNILGLTYPNLMNIQIKKVG